MVSGKHATNNRNGGGTIKVTNSRNNIIGAGKHQPGGSFSISSGNNVLAGDHYLSNALD